MQLMPQDRSTILSPLLLAGWTMLQESCTTCYSPYMRPPNNEGPDRCAYCEAQNQNPPGVVDIPMLNDRARSENSMDDDEKDSPGEYCQVNGMAAGPQTASNTDHDFRRQQLIRASEALGEKMLLGYALLGDICPNTSCFAVPLLRLPQDRSKRLCVLCDNTYDANNTPLNPPTVLETPQQTPANLPGHDRMSLNATSSVEKTINAISQFLETESSKIPTSSDPSESLRFIRDCAETILILQKIAK
ncbi:hypothetical protein NEOLI_003654 [Neolecta irregularis DAH-3]|uniref:Uncharacterized protein n=1 Tax=Neolecta irregularis (strain DAH-3) TaxID=1198029 RepID=A0A1U7LNJ0_NEOID|nr:hypothetical protein NEOLI_003654 [Neolecta irregularis DAH-3]|eukprot:OLL24217.1 hypothetical protein NEOLI_003654 [Neolecta irregularis DAH-3]